VDAESVTRRPNRVLAIVLGVVAVVAVVAVVVSTTRSAPTYDRGTPTGIVQAYLSAVIEGDHAEAAAFLAAESPCEIEDLDRAYVPEEARVVLRDSEVGPDTARVQVEVLMSPGGIFDEYAEVHNFRLVKQDDDWLITGEPWPMFDCAGTER
jgi:hypothetical protein